MSEEAHAEMTMGEGRRVAAHDGCEGSGSANGGKLVISAAPLWLNQSSLRVGRAGV